MGRYWEEFALIAGLILLNAFFAAGEIAVVSSRPVRVRQQAEQGIGSAKALLRLMQDQSRFLATVQVGITLAGFLASASAAVGLSNDMGLLLQSLGLPAAISQEIALVVVTIVLSYFTLVLGELVPKRLALQSPERIALIVARPVALLSRVTGPFTSFLTWSTNMVVRLLGGKVERADFGISEEELRVYVEEHRDLTEEEKRMITGVFDFGDRLVRQMMVPRPEMKCIHQDASLPEALDYVRTYGFWRYPVFREDYDDIVGVVTVKDLIYHVGSDAGETAISSIMRQAIFVPEVKPALDLLKELQTADEQMAIVIDEYGGVAGLVTLEDLLEEIVGEVSEEESPGAGLVEQLLDPTETVEEIADRLNIRLPKSPHYETLAGYVLHLLGSIPTVGTSVEIEGWRLVIERMDGHRIDQIKAIPLTPLPPPDQGGSPTK